MCKLGKHNALLLELDEGIPAETKYALLWRTHPCSLQRFLLHHGSTLGWGTVLLSEPIHNLTHAKRGRKRGIRFAGARSHLEILYLRSIRIVYHSRSNKCLWHRYGSLHSSAACQQICTLPGVSSNHSDRKPLKKEQRSRWPRLRLYPSATSTPSL